MCWGVDFRKPPKDAEGNSKSDFAASRGRAGGGRGSSDK